MKKSQVKLSTTLPKGYIVITPESKQSELVNLKGILSILKLAEKNNVALSQNLVQVLGTLTPETFKEIKTQFEQSFKTVKGQFLRSAFATGSDVNDESFTYNDFLIQINHYFITYGLGEIDENIFKTDENRKVQISNISKRKEKQDINNTFRIINVKDMLEFVGEVRTILESPIVFGSQQIEFIQEADRCNVLDLVIELTKDIKVKENLFQLITIAGKDFVKDNNVLKTATDILRYAYWASDEDFKTIPVGIKFKLKTSDKKVIMSSLNKITKKDIKNVFGDMKPNKSQWLAVSKNLFPGSSKFNKFTDAQGVFDFLRNGGKVRTFNTITQELIKNKEFVELTKHLSNKPGELLRSLDMIIRNVKKDEVDLVISYISNIKLNPKLVIQVRKWLSYRTENALLSRTFKVKGKPVTIENKPLEELKTKRTMKIVKVLRNIMVKHLMGKELFGTQIAQIEKFENELEKTKSIAKARESIISLMA